MPIQLETPKDFQNARTLPFCYLCGERLPAAKCERNRDHVPPTTIFLEPDREPPLILITHSSCNNKESSYDQAIGQLVGLLHGKAPEAKHSKLKLEVQATDGGAETLVLRGVDLQDIIRRWIRAFHAALYKEPLPKVGRFVTGVPLPSGTVEGDAIKPEPIPEALAKFVETLKCNRATGNVDRIDARNGKCRYECVWTRADNNGPWLCVYCLDIYDWIKLGDERNFAPRGCVGSYLLPDNGVPRFATTATQLIFNVPNLAPNDPFAD